MQSKRCRQVLCTGRPLTWAPQTLICCPHNRETLSHNQGFMTYLLFNLCCCLRCVFEGMKITITLSPIDVCPLPLATNKVVHIVSWDNVFLAEYCFLAVAPQCIGRPTDILWFPDLLCWKAFSECVISSVDWESWMPHVGHAEEGTFSGWGGRDKSQGLSSPASSLIHGTTLRCLHTILGNAWRDWVQVVHNNNLCLGTPLLVGFLPFLHRAFQHYLVPRSLSQRLIWGNPS